MVRGIRSNDEVREGFLLLTLCGARRLSNFSSRSRVVVVLWAFGQKLGRALKMGFDEGIGSSIGAVQSESEILTGATRHRYGEPGPSSEQELIVRLMLFS